MPTLMNLAESVMSANSAIYNAEKFHAACWDCARMEIGKGETDEALKEAADRKELFFELFEKTRPSSEPYAACGADCASHSALFEFARHGYSKEGDDLEQVNVFVACEEGTGIPISWLTRFLRPNTMFPRGKKFEEREWIGLTKEQRMPPHTMGIKEMDDRFPGTGHDS